MQRSTLTEKQMGANNEVVNLNELISSIHGLIMSVFMRVLKREVHLLFYCYFIIK